MTPLERTASYRAGRLLQFALRPEVKPERNDEYATLLLECLNDLSFREQVDGLAAGLGLEILDLRQGYSLLLAPLPGSPFEMTLSEYRSSTTAREEDRLLDGLIHVAIAATVFPRPADLLSDDRLSRNPITVEEVELGLRALVERLKAAAQGHPDPELDKDGLQQAWRVYDRRQSAQRTRDGRSATRSTRRMIEHALEHLCRQRCFAFLEKQGQYQPQRRYAVLVQQYAASRLYQTIQKALAPAAHEDT